MHIAKIKKKILNIFASKVKSSNSYGRSLAKKVVGFKVSSLHRENNARQPVHSDLINSYLADDPADDIVHAIVRGCGCDSPSQIWKKGPLLVTKWTFFLSREGVQGGGGCGSECPLLGSKRSTFGGGGSRTSQKSILATGLTLPLLLYNRPMNSGYFHSLILTKFAN